MLVTLTMLVVLLILGMFMPSSAMQMISIPMFVPLALNAGIPMLWLGVFFTFCGEIALLTPPVGVNLFVLKGISGLPFKDVVFGLLPYVGLLLLGLVILYIFPGLTTWLPGMMLG